MKVVLQRVSEAKVVVEGKTVGAIGPGLVVFLGITHGDTQDQVTFLANKLINLRIFEDSQGKINHSLLETKGDVLIISQFTLYANCNDGRRPSFIQAAPPDLAKTLYEQFITQVQKSGLHVQTGIFGAMMSVSLVNEGPFTLLLENNTNNVQ